MLITRRLYTLLGRNSPTEDRDVEQVCLPWNRLAALTPFDPEPEHLIWRDQIGNPKSLIIESKDNDVNDNTKERIIV